MKQFSHEVVEYSVIKLNFFFDKIIHKKLIFSISGKSRFNSFLLNRDNQSIVFLKISCDVKV